MKKMAMALAAALMVLGVSTAFAATPSKTTTDVTHVQKVEAVKEDGTVAAADGWNLEVTEDADEVTSEIAKIYAHVVTAGNSAVSYFPTETQEALAELFGKDFDVKTLSMNEFVTLKLTGFEKVTGDAKVVFTFTTKYEVGKKVAVVLGLYNGERDAKGQYVVDWKVLEAEVLENGDLSVVFPLDVLAQMNDAVAVSMAVLGE